ARRPVLRRGDRRHAPPAQRLGLRGAAPLQDRDRRPRRLLEGRRARLSPPPSGADYSPSNLVTRYGTGVSAFLPGLTFPNENANTIFSGVCLNSFITAARTGSASSRSGLFSSAPAKLTVTDASRPLCQLKPTRGLIPVDCSTFRSTACACL